MNPIFCNGRKDSCGDERCPICNGSLIPEENKRHSLWIIEITRKAFRGTWIEAEQRFYLSEIAAKEKMAWLEKRSGAAWDFRVSEYARKL